MAEQGRMKWQWNWDETGKHVENGEMGKRREEARRRGGGREWNDDSNLEGNNIWLYDILQ